MAGMLCSDDVLVPKGLSNPAWKSSPSAGLVRVIYSSYWQAHLGELRAAVQLVRRMASLGRGAFQWQDHAILRMLDRLATLAKFVSDEESANCLNLIRAQAAAQLGDVSALASAAYQLRDFDTRFSHTWMKIACLSGYSSLPGIPSFLARKKTTAEGRVLLRTLDEDLVNIYESFNRNGEFRQMRGVAA